MAPPTPPPKGSVKQSIRHHQDSFTGQSPPLPFPFLSSRSGSFCRAAARPHCRGRSERGHGRCSVRQGTRIESTKHEPSSCGGKVRGPVATVLTLRSSVQRSERADWKLTYCHASPQLVLLSCARDAPQTPTHDRLAFLALALARAPPRARTQWFNRRSTATRLTAHATELGPALADVDARLARRRGPVRAHLAHSRALLVPGRAGSHRRTDATPEPGAELQIFAPTGPVTIVVLVPLAQLVQLATASAAAGLRAPATCTDPTLDIGRKLL